MEDVHRRIPEASEAIIAVSLEVASFGLSVGIQDAKYHVIVLRSMTGVT